MEIKDEAAEQDVEVEDLSDEDDEKKQAGAPVEDQTTQCSVPRSTLRDDMSRSAYQDFVSNTEGK